MADNTSPPPAGASVADPARGAAKAGNNTILFVIIGLVVLGVIGMGAYFGIKALTGSSNKTTTDEEEEETTIELNKDEYEQGEEIRVTYSVVETLHDGAWIGIMDSDTDHNDEEEADAADVSYQYLYGDEDGTITMYAPWEDGEYDVRIYDSDETTADELGYVTFDVVTEEDGSYDFEENYLLLDDEVYGPGDDITVYYTTDGTLSDFAWIGVVPSDVEHGSESTNDANDTDYEWISDTYGTITLEAPLEPGEYDVRMNDDDDELVYTSFTVEEDR